MLFCLSFSQRVLSHPPLLSGVETIAFWFFERDLDLPQLCPSLDYTYEDDPDDGFCCWSAEERRQKLIELSSAAQKMEPASVVVFGTEFDMREIEAVKGELVLVLPSGITSGLRLEVWELVSAFAALDAMFTRGSLFVWVFVNNV
jgi:hypothetical protein